jgi:hypothetical protein
MWHAKGMPYSQYFGSIGLCMGYNPIYIRKPIVRMFSEFPMHKNPIHIEITIQGPVV